jgi:hypothetical protein
MVSPDYSGRGSVNRIPENKRRAAVAGEIKEEGFRPYGLASRGTRLPDFFHSGRRISHALAMIGA